MKVQRISFELDLHGPAAEHARDEGWAVVAAAAAAQEEEGVGLDREEDDHQARQREQSGGLHL